MRLTWRAPVPIEGSGRTTPAPRDQRRAPAAPTPAARARRCPHARASPPASAPGCACWGRCSRAEPKTSARGYRTLVAVKFMLGQSSETIAAESKRVNITKKGRASLRRLYNPGS